MRNILFLLTFLTFGLVSCVQEPEGTGSVSNSDRTVFSAKIENGSSATRAVAAVAGENNVGDLTLLFFEPTNDKSGKFVGYYKVPASDLSNAGEFEFSIKFTAESGLSKSGAYNYLAIANFLDGNYFTNEAALNAFLEDLASRNKTEATVKSEMVKFVKGQDVQEDGTLSYDKKLLRTAYLPMTGSGVKTENVDLSSFSLLRTVARFDVQNSASDYYLRSVAIFNAFSYPTAFENVATDYNQAHTEFFYGVKTGLDADNNRAQSITGGLYSTVNNVSNPSQNDKKTTCLIIGLQKKVEAEENIQYFRVNIHPESVGQYLKRNNVYKVVISKINRQGKTNEVSAYESGEESLDIAINTWDRDEDGLILSNGDNMLALPTIKATFGPEAETRVYSIFTMGQGVLEMEVKGEDGKYTKVSDNVECTLISDVSGSMKAKRNGTTLTLSVDAYGGDVREGTLRFSFAGLVGEMDVVQDGTEKKQLKLSHTTVPNYPAGGSTASMLTNPILISSAGETVGTTVGPWTATILLSNGFSFDNNEEILVMQGGNGDKIDKVYALGINGADKPLINFILVTLDADPSNFRNVVILTQNATGNYTLIPNVPALQFNADKTVYPNQENMFNAKSGEETDNWEVSIRSNTYDTDKQKFKLYVTENNLTSEVETLPYVVNNKPGITFTVRPAADNYYGLLEAAMVVKQNGANTKEVRLTQDFYRMTLSPKVTTISAKGGKLTFQISLPSSGKKMSAKLTHNVGEASGGTYTPVFAQNGAGTLEGVDVGNLEVVIPRIGSYVGQIVGAPTITLEVTIDGTELKETAVITQDKIAFPSSLNVHTLTDSYGYWRGNGLLFQAWKTVMGNSSLFGPSGTVWAPSNIGGFENIGYASNTVLASDVRIWNVNQRDFNASYGALAGNWMGKENHFVILSTYDQNGMFQYIFGSGNHGGYSTQNGYNNASRNQTPNSAPSKSKETELWKYLVGGEGPFGEVDVTRITNLGGGDNACIGLTAWPSTFIPLIMSSTNSSRCMVGIDPTNRFIWVGDTEIFHTNTQNNYGNSSSEESKFFQNIIGYIINVTLYGDVFNDQFKVK